jgi:hypothetical protein
MWIGSVGWYMQLKWQDTAKILRISMFQVLLYSTEISAPNRDLVRLFL